MDSSTLAQVAADFATLLIVGGTLGCLVWPPKIIWERRIPAMRGDHRELSFFVMSVLIVGLLMSVAAIALRWGWEYFWALLTSVVGVVLVMGALHLVDHLLGRWRSRRAGPNTGTAPEPQL